VIALESRTDDWNEASAWVAAYSNQYYDLTNLVYGLTNEVLDITNRLDFLEARTNDWNDAHAWVAIYSNYLYKPAFGSGYLTNDTQQVLAANVWNIITNFQGVGAVNMGTLTDSNLTVLASAWYRLSGYFSFDSSTNAVDVQMAAFTNGVMASNIQSRVYFVQNAQYAELPFGGPLYMLSGAYVDLRLKPDKNTTLIFNHGDATLQRMTKD
jgi:hypothetical protein